jgi:hypothetical protein
MSFSFRVLGLLMLAFTSSAMADNRHPRDAEIPDPETRSWWHTTEALSGDDMEGRDTGSAAYQRAAELVAARFKAAGLEPAGEDGSYFQTVPMRELSVLPQGTSFTITRKDGSSTQLAFLQQVTFVPARGLPSALDGPLSFRGYCGRQAMRDVEGKVVICFGSQRTGFPDSAERAANAHAGHAAAIISVLDPYFSIEPPRWPVAYARSVSLRDGPEPQDRSSSLEVMTVSAEGFAELIRNSGQDATSILQAGGARQSLPNFEIPARARVRTHLAEREISSPNVLAKLPGSNPALADQFVVLSAHLDGYGFGTPVKGDNLYNGTLDDAAYVALLIETADAIKSKKLAATQRGLLFAAFTGEEKGLLGSKWFVAHPTIALERIAADINLDQLRPLYPLDILTVEALDDTTLGAMVRRIADGMHIEVRPDREPERNLLRRADQYPFLVNHVPAISFLFGYDAGTESERRYREWYALRYHRPQDDLAQPVDFLAAAKFNEFFQRLVTAVGDAPGRPEFLADR